MEEKKQLVDLILGRNECENRKSTLQMALEVARYLCGYKVDDYYSIASFNWGRNTSDDVYNPVVRPTSKQSDIFASLLLYLIALEQIGNMFIEPISANDTNGIAGSFYKYSVLKDDENGSKTDKIDAIKHLRHSLAHNLGLAIIDKSKKPEKCYKYTLELYSDDTYIIKLPEIKWDGDWSEKSEKTSTKIHPFNLIKEIERIISAIQSDRNIVFVKDKDSEEIRTKYTIITE